MNPELCHVNFRYTRNTEFEPNFVGSVRFSSAEHRREDAPGFIVKKEYVPEAETVVPEGSGEQANG